MPDQRIATVRAIDENEATARVAAIFTDIKLTKNITFVPNFWRTLATDPVLLDSVWTTLSRVEMWRGGLGLHSGGWLFRLPVP